jgi:hypothetical protein
MRLPSRSPRLVPLLTSALAGVLLVGSAGVPSYAASDEPGADPVTEAVVDPGTPTEIAEDSLAAAEDLVAGDSTQDPTLVLNQLSQTLDDLPSGDQRKAERILGRPTDGNDPEDVLLTYEDSFGTPVPEEAPYSLGAVCVHYVGTTRHAPPMADGNADGIPDWVDQTARVMGNVWNREIAQLGYRAPLPDRGATPAGTANDEGPDTRLDVYLGDIGKDGYYGYAATDRPNPRTSSAYLVLDDDFGDFAGPATPGQLMRVTAAHEFFHIVQFAYDQYEDGWFMESTATWMEERVYDAVNDNRQYLRSSAMELPGRSLDYPLTTSTAYGNWIFFEFLSRRLGGAVVRSMWSRAAADGVYSTVAISRTLKAEGTSLRARFAGFAANNLYPARTYAEGESYRRPRVAATYALSSTAPGTGGRTTRVDHLAARSYAFTAGSSLTGSRKVRLKVNAPSGISGAVAIVSRADGTLSVRSVPLSSAGNGSLTLPFSRSSVKRVTLTLSNTSVRYACGAGSYSCNGRPRDQNEPFRFSATAVR